MAEKCNDFKCTCPETSCPRHGKCCECVDYHLKRKSLTMCFRQSLKLEKDGRQSQ